MAYAQPPVPNPYTYDPNAAPAPAAPVAYTAPAPAPYQPAPGGAPPVQQQPQAPAPVHHQQPVPVAAPPQAQAPQAPAATAAFDLDDLLDTGNNGTVQQKASIPPPPSHPPPPAANQDPFGFAQQQQAAAPPVAPPQPHVAPPQAAPVQPQQPAVDPYTYQAPPTTAQPTAAPPVAAGYTAPPTQPAPPVAQAAVNYAQPAPTPAPVAPAQANPYTYQPPQAEPAPTVPPTGYATQPTSMAPTAPGQPVAQPGYAPPPQAGMVDPANPYAPPTTAQPTGAYAAPPQAQQQQQGGAVQDDWQKQQEADRARLEEIARLKREIEAEEERAKDIKAEKDTWPCPTCTFRTPLTEFNCQMCDTPRPGYSAKASRPAAEPKVTIAQPVSQPPAIQSSFGTWSCPNCFASNSDAANICKVCNTARPEHPTPSDQGVRPNAGGGASSAPNPNVWSCAVCTLENPLSAAACQACQNPRPAHIQAPPPSQPPAQVVQAQPISRPPITASTKWSCPTCTFENPKTAPKCTMCETPQPGYVAPTSSRPAGGGSTAGSGYPGAGRQPSRRQGGGGGGQRGGGRSPQAQGDASADEEIRWQDDKFATNCNKCNATFSMFVRKHHCRACGFIFCGNCSNFKGKLKPTDKEEVRMCIDCYRERHPA